MGYGIPHYLKRDATIRMAHGYSTYALVTSRGKRILLRQASTSTIRTCYVCSSSISREIVGAPISSRSFYDI